MRIACFVVALLALSTSTVNAAFKQSLASSTSYPPVAGLTNLQGSYYSSNLNGLYSVDAGTGNLAFTPLIPGLQTVPAGSGSGSFTGRSFPAGTAYDPLSGNAIANNGLIGYDDGAHGEYASAGIYARASMALVYLGVLSTTDFNNIDQKYLSSLALSAQYSNTNPITSGIPPVGATYAMYNFGYQASDPYHYVKLRVDAVSAAPANGLTVSSTWYTLGSRYTVLGNGYNQPQHVTLSKDGKTAYISEAGTGNVLKIAVGSAAGSMNRASATVLATVTNPRQLALDETTNSLFVIENAASGTIKQIDLSGVNPLTTISTGFNGGIGLLLPKDGQTLYVSEQGASRISKVSRATGLITPLVSITSPSYLSWQDDTQVGIIIPQTNSFQIAITVLQISNNVGYTLFVPYQTQVSSVQYVSSSVYTVVSQTEIAVYSTTPFNLNGPLLLGIGLVPASAITSGEATTAPGYMFHVTNSPFGGSLALMVNHDYGRKLGATRYAITIDGNVITDSWGDYKWDPTQNMFVYTTATQYSATIGAAAGYAVRTAGDVWYNYWLGGFVNTAGVSNGLHTIQVTFYTPIGFLSWSTSSSSVQILVDNTWPTAIINEIDYYPSWISDSNIGAPSIVPTCGIVTGNKSDAFSFQITAADGDQHLLSYSLSAVWGDNQGAGITSDTYSPNHSGSINWAGITNTHLPISPQVWHAKVPGDITSYQCAHTFTLGVWDRTINGYGYIHYAQYTRSITLMLNL